MWDLDSFHLCLFNFSFIYQFYSIMTTSVKSSFFHLLLKIIRFCDIMQGPLKIWTEHSTFPLQGRGTQTHYSFTGIQYVFWKKVWKNFSKHTKGEGMIKFYIYHILVENSVNSVIYFFWALLQAAKIWSSSKNAHVWVHSLKSLKF